MLSLFAKDATLTSDGGGVVPAARKVVHGRSRIARLYLLLAKRLGSRLRKEILTINGEHGLVMYLDGAPLAATSFETDGNVDHGSLHGTQSRKTLPAFHCHKLALASSLLLEAPISGMIH